MKFIDEKTFFLQSMANDNFVRVDDQGLLIADVPTCSVEAPRTDCIFEMELPKPS